MSLILAGCGICGGSLYFITENSALQITLASNVSLIICTAPLFTSILSHAFIKGERMGKNLIIGSIIAMAGVAFVVFNGSFVLELKSVGRPINHCSSPDLGILQHIAPKNRQPIFYPVHYTKSLFLRNIDYITGVLFFTATNLTHHPLYPDRYRQYALSGIHRLIMLLYLIQYGRKTSGKRNH